MTKISYYDLDRYGRLKFSALLRLAHIAADENATELGIGYTQLAPLGMAFLLQRFSASARRLPEYGESVAIRTWPTAIERGLFIRKGEMRSANGEKILEWANLWLLFDLNARKILKPAALPIETDALLLGNQGVETAPEKVALPRPWEEWERSHSTHAHTVRFSDVDTNAHMNNAIYGDVISNAVYPAEAAAPPWTRLDINYLSETRPGEEMYVQARVAAEASNEIYITGETPPRRTFAARVLLG